MDNETLEALKRSIKKWEEIVAETGGYLKTPWKKWDELDLLKSLLPTSVDEALAMTTIYYMLTRDVSKNECPWLDRELMKGTFVRFTYGCISPLGKSFVKLNAEIPFFELPSNAVELFMELPTGMVEELNGNK